MFRHGHDLVEAREEVPAGDALPLLGDLEQDAPARDHHREPAEVARVGEQARAGLCTTPLPDDRERWRVQRCEVQVVVESVDADPRLRVLAQVRSADRHQVLTVPHERGEQVLGGADADGRHFQNRHEDLQEEVAVGVAGRGPDVAEGFRGDVGGVRHGEDAARVAIADAVEESVLAVSHADRQRLVPRRDAGDDVVVARRLLSTVAAFSHDPDLEGLIRAAVAHLHFVRLLQVGRAHLPHVLPDTPGEFWDLHEDEPGLVGVAGDLLALGADAVASPAHVGRERDGVDPEFCQDVSLLHR